jgi:hypothetical protein
MPEMFGVPVTGYNPIATHNIGVNQGEALVARQHATTMKNEETINNEIPNDLDEAVRQREEAVRLLDLAKSPKDKEIATNLVNFWESRIAQLKGGNDNVPEIKTAKIPQVIQPPDIFSKISKSAINRVKNPRNKRHKEEKKKPNKVSWII